MATRALKSRPAGRKPLKRVTHPGAIGVGLLLIALLVALHLMSNAVQNSDTLSRAFVPLLTVVLVGLFALALMRLTPTDQPARRPSAWQELGEGLRFVIGHEHVRLLVALVAVVAFFGITFGTLLPAWAVDVLGGDATTNGFLQSARGIGALLGALSVASLGRFQFHGRLLTLASFAFPEALLVFAAIRIDWLAMAVLVLVGVSMLVIFNVANAMVQTLAPDALRGRVMGIYSLAFFGFMPLGGLAAGALADRIGAPLTVTLAAAAVLVFAAAVRIFQPGLSRLQ